MTSLEKVLANHANVVENGHMAKEPSSKKRSGRRGDPVSAAPLTPEQLVKGIFQISKEDVKRIVASRPGKRKPKQG